MRPSLLDPFFAPLTHLSGFGEKSAPLFERLLGTKAGETRIKDLLFHLPTQVMDRACSPTIQQAPLEGLVTFEGVVESYVPPPLGRGNAPSRVIVGDESGDVTLVFFRMSKAQISALLPLGARRIISGRMELFDGIRQMVHPERVYTPTQYAQTPRFEPIYPMTEGVSSKRIASLIAKIFSLLPQLPEWIDEALCQREAWPRFIEALQKSHNPQGEAELSPQAPSYRRLAYDEIFAGQIALQILRQKQQGTGGHSIQGDGRLRALIRAQILYQLTNAQERCLKEISADMATPRRMLRLLQGDVGAGKTITALLAMAEAVEAGYQAALMAPTEILARQHAARLAPLAEAAGMKIRLLVGKMPTSERKTALLAIETGDADLVIGTHALFQESVKFARLGLAVIDEQHRFGVHQRLSLSQKGEGADLLVMTATPIPRTLVLSAFGDLDVSILDEKPPGRQPIDTRLVNMERLDEVVDGLSRAIHQGARIYWVCPWISATKGDDQEEGEDNPNARPPPEKTNDFILANVEERYAMLAARFPNRVGFVHGRLPSAEKERALQRFQAGEDVILVATSVIEVGVDVAAASIMVIEDAQHFGLAQLHQLRGRVGRGQAQSNALLLFRPPLSENARARLEIMRKTEDGFRIAEEDWRLRGEGDVLGTRQSGLPGFHIARLDQHQDLIRIAKQDAELLLQRDPNLSSARGQAATLLLYLFDRYNAHQLMEAG